MADPVISKNIDGHMENCRFKGGVNFTQAYQCTYVYAKTIYILLLK